jgi:UDP-N-acetylmuramate: L-alanyl-gamma-D-glutamyl-meso-diaminopimelate ligase
MMQKKAHFIGTAGMGMSATAILLKEQGWDVGGSDSEAYPPGTNQLKKHGIAFASRYDPANIPHDADLIVIGMNAKLTRENNAEVRAAHESGIRIVSFPEILGEIVVKREVLVVAGSYGKSTITSLIAWCLSHSGTDAGWFIGAAPEGMAPAHLGTHPVFVIEGDEYPTSHDDPRPKLAHYPAHDCVVTAATHDHVNIYKTQSAFLEPFRALAASLPDDGILVLSADEPHAASLAKDTRAEVVTYGMTAAADWHAGNVAHGTKTTFELMHGEKSVATLSTALIGEHNISNIVGAAAMLLEKQLITPEQLSAAVKDFKGPARRLDKKTSRSSVPAYEGFGSSREKLRAAISALKGTYPDKRIVVVFEPHTFSWRNSNMLYWFDTAFEGAGLIVLYKPAEQGAATHEQSTQKEMVERLAKTGIPVETAVNGNEVMDTLQKQITKDDLVLLSSSGPMDGLIEEIPKWLDNTFA